VTSAKSHRGSAAAPPRLGSRSPAPSEFGGFVFWAEYVRARRAGEAVPAVVLAYLDRAAVAVLRHLSPAGTAVDEPLAETFLRAFEIPKVPGRGGLRGKLNAQTREHKVIMIAIRLAYDSDQFTLKQVDEQVEATFGITFESAEKLRKAAFVGLGRSPKKVILETVRLLRSRESAIATPGERELALRTALTVGTLWMSAPLSHDDTAT
jgi:hypothetical protein